MCEYVYPEDVLVEKIIQEETRCFIANGETTCVHIKPSETGLQSQLVKALIGSETLADSTPIQDQQLKTDPTTGEQCLVIEPEKVSFLENPAVARDFDIEFENPE